MKEFISEMEGVYKKLIEHGGNPSPKKVATVQRFNEYLMRLGKRYEILLVAEKNLYGLRPGKDEKRVAALQLDFVNWTEAFYQELYATLSAFVMLLNHLGDREFGQLPIRSVGKFLGVIDKKVNGITELKNTLDEARAFRAKFIDHPQQHVLHDWMTHSLPSIEGPKAVVIYFVKKGSGIYWRGLIDPHAPSFRPPFDCESFYVSPPHRKVYNSLKDFIRRVLWHICLIFQ